MQDIFLTHTPLLNKLYHTCFSGHLRENAEGVKSMSLSLLTRTRNKWSCSIWASCLVLMGHFWRPWPWPITVHSHGEHGRGYQTKTGKRKLSYRCLRADGTRALASASTAWVTAGAGAGAAAWASGTGAATCGEAAKIKQKYKRGKSQKPSDHANARISHYERLINQNHVVLVWSQVQETVEHPGVRSRINIWIAWKTNKNLLHVSHSHPHATPRLFKHLIALLQGSRSKLRESLVQSPIIASPCLLTNISLIAMLILSNTSPLAGVAYLSPSFSYTTAFSSSLYS